MVEVDHLNSIIRHIKRVEDNCNLLARKIEDPDFARLLIQRGRLHDASKLDEFEFIHLKEDNPFFLDALKRHHKNNRHHPEYHKRGIHDMIDLDIAEMVCDCVARGQEFGTDTRKWFAETATKKYNFSMYDHIGQLVSKYLDLLLSKPFKS